MATKPEDLLAMSDEDIMNMSAPPEAVEAPKQEEKPAEQEPTKEGEAPSEEGKEVPPVGSEPKADDPKVEEKVEPKDEGKETNPLDPHSPKPVDKTEEKSTSESKLEGGDPKSKPDETVVEAPVNYQEMYTKVMAPFKANGKTIEVKSPEEAIKLMQMGANYTRKMQDIQPHRKVLMMLENNGLLDESKLSYLIDLDKKDPNAIRKLVKDAGIDPLEIDNSVDPNYLEGSHKVSDQEANFKSVLEDLGSTDTGKETLQAINKWDNASKELLWAHPEVMTIIHQQFENGVYETISKEVERRQTLGQIAPTVAFIDAYKTVGDELYKPVAQPAVVTPTPKLEPIATTVAKPKSDVENDDKAGAASSTRTVPQKAEKFVNPLAMSDDEFLKQMNGRL